MLCSNIRKIVFSKCKRLHAQLSANPQNMALKNYKIVNEVKVLWRLVAVGNGSKIPLFVFFNTFNTSPR